MNHVWRGIVRRADGLPPRLRFLLGLTRRALWYAVARAQTGDDKLAVRISKKAVDAACLTADKAGGLSQIDDEGFVDRGRIARVTTFDPTKELEAGQQRFATSVRFAGVANRQYFRADETALRGTPVIDLTSSRPGGGKVPGGRPTSAPVFV